MKVAVVGGGFTGLAAAYELTRRGHNVTLFEAGPVLGGQAYGFKEPDWGWHLEYAYHHWFTNDRAVLGLIKELGLSDKLIIKRPITANLLTNAFLSSSGLTRGSALSKADSRLRGNDNNTQIVQLDSPLHLLRFPGLSMIDKLRTAALLAFLKLTPFWKPLENLTAEQLLTSIGGSSAYQALWEPLLVGKFGDFAPKIQAAWFWARIKKRTARLAYMEGGFYTLIAALEKAIKKQGGIIHTNTRGAPIKSLSGFDKILLTVPSPVAQKIIPQLQITPVPHLTAQTLILETDKPILDRVYWLNITDRSFPFLAVVAHTNFMDKTYYGNHHLTYFGNYLPPGHKYLSMNKEQVLNVSLPFIQRLTHNSKFIIHNSFLFVGPYAQPVHELHYSSRAPKLETPIPNVYLANMDSIVPWDRGTNYAVALGMRAAKKILEQ